MANNALPVRERWTKDEAWDWYNKQPWICGFNFLPSTAVNSTEMWQSDSFDEKTIERELGWAFEYGYNSCRVFLQYLVWKNDPEGLKQRIDRFLQIAEKYNISTMPILFDDCAFAEKEPYYGKQDEPVPGIHNSGWTPSPGPRIADDISRHAELEAYVKDLLKSFSSDSRILAWDLYNEPGNSKRKEKSRALLTSAFEWAREVNPGQPLTAGAWGCEATDKTCLELSDVITFHCYQNYDKTKDRIEKLKAEGYPLINTEWMARKFECFINTVLPLYKENGIGCYQWGLVQGKTQTYYPWGSTAGAPEPEIWFHDVLRPDGTPYRSEELELVKKLSDNKTVLELNPVEMTPAVMQTLEDKGLIYRLCPGHHELNTAEGETLGAPVYKCEEKYGPHMLITVTVNRSVFAAFGTHPDNEDFLLIGDPDTKPMYLVIALCLKGELSKKIADRTLSNEDFVALRVKYNDPQVSFFTMLKDVPHGEAVAESVGRPASFYVTEPRDMPLDKTDFGTYTIKVR